MKKYKFEISNATHRNNLIIRYKDDFIIAMYHSSGYSMDLFWIENPDGSGSIIKIDGVDDI